MLALFSYGSLADIFANKARVGRDFAASCIDLKESAEYARGRSEAWGEAEKLLREYIARNERIEKEGQNEPARSPVA